MTNPVSRPRRKIKWYWWALGGTAAVGVVWIAYRRNQASAAATTDTSSTDTQSQDYYGTGTDLGSYSPGTVGYYTDPYGNPITPGPGQTVVTVPTSHAEWEALAVGKMTAAGYDPVTVTTALGLWLNNSTISQAQWVIVQTALGLQGPPPDPQPVLHLAPPSSQTNPTRLASPHLAVRSRSKTTAVLAWNSVPHATQYYVRRNGIVTHRVTTTSVTVTRGAVFTVESVNAPSYYRSLPSNPVVA